MRGDRKFPILRYVLLCGEVCEGDDGLPDAYGILSEMTIGSGPNEPQYFDLKLHVLVSIYTEDEGETYPITLAVKTPSGHEGKAGGLRLGNVGGRFYSTLGAPFSMEVDRPGTYWVKVYHGRRLLGETSLKINFRRSKGGGPTGH